jgi:cytochrome c-type biogenesis protein CcmH/NrfG
MKKEFVFLSVGIAFIVGIVVGVVLTVYHEDRTLVSPLSVKDQAPAGSTAPSEEIIKQINILKNILRDDPKNLNALIELGNAYFDTDQFDKAIESYSRALEIDPQNADVRTDLGIMYRRKKDFDRAIIEFKKAAELDSQHANSRYNLGIVLLHDKGDMKSAINAWEEFLRVEPSSQRSENIRNQLGKMKNMIK